jgi:hypothetical protein
MLFNPKWNALTLPALTAWLKNQPPARKYIYGSNVSCLLARYLKDCGYKRLKVGASFFIHRDGDANIPRKFNYIASMEPHTFGAALKRARESGRLK